MKEERSLDRREFTRESLLALLAGVTVTVSSCGGGGGGGSSAGGGPVAPTAPAPTPTPSASPVSAEDVVGAVSSNHGHRAVVTGAQLSAGGAARLDIRGEADHTHVVDLTSTEVVRISDGQAVAKDSSPTDAHTHTVTFLRGASPDDSGRY